VEQCGNARQAIDHNIIWRLRSACWIAKSTGAHTHTHRICNNYRSSGAKMVTRTRLSVPIILTLSVLINSPVTLQKFDRMS